MLYTYVTRGVREIVREICLDKKKNAQMLRCRILEIVNKFHLFYSSLSHDAQDICVGVHQ